MCESTRSAKIFSTPCTGSRISNCGLAPQPGCPSGDPALRISDLNTNVRGLLALVRRFEIRKSKSEFLTMPEPEILRRCAVCGAASRPGALFCPQCGNAATRTSGASGAAPAPERQDASSEQPLDPGLQTRKRNPGEGGVRPQVEKLRKASSIVLDEATYDPSVRFVLVAAVLFVLFLVILLLSKMIT